MCQKKSTRKQSSFVRVDRPKTSSWISAITNNNSNIVTAIIHWSWKANYDSSTIKLFIILNILTVVIEPGYTWPRDSTHSKKCGPFLNLLFFKYNLLVPFWNLPFLGLCCILVIVHNFFWQTYFIYQVMVCKNENY